MITIRDLRENVVFINHLKPGDTFIYGEKLYMLTDAESIIDMPDNTGDVVAMQLATGELFSFDSDLEITPVECAVHVYNVLKEEE